MDDKELIALAKKALRINKPYYRAEVINKPGFQKVTFWLYGGTVERWAWDHKQAKFRDEPARAIDQPVPGDELDFTVIPGVGAVTAKKLNDHGVFTMAMLRQAWDVWLYQEMTRHLTQKQLDAISKYVKEETR